MGERVFLESFLECVLRAVGPPAHLAACWWWGRNDLHARHRRLLPPLQFAPWSGSALGVQGERGHCRAWILLVGAGKRILHFFTLEGAGAEGRCHCAESRKPRREGMKTGPLAQGSWCLVSGQRSGVSLALRPLLSPEKQQLGAPRSRRFPNQTPPRLRPRRGTFPHSVDSRSRQSSNTGA